MPSKMTFLFGVPMFVGCCAILWIYWDRFKKPSKPPPSDQICPNKLSDKQNEAAVEEMAKVEETMEDAKAEEKMAQAIFISADCWLWVFDLITPSQLGLGIAMISHRFDYYVDEHFKTRKRTLAFIRIRSKIGENGTKEMAITNSSWNSLPIPQIQMPRKVIGFEHIIIKYIDQNVIAFLRHFRPLFAACQINLTIFTWSDRISESILHNIWPLLGENIRFLRLSAIFFHRLRQFAPSILNDLPLLRVVNFYVDADDLFTEFPADENAMASDGQAVAKWLFTPLQSNVPKVLKFYLCTYDGNLATKIEAIKAAFASASSPANFIVVIRIRLPFADSVVPFDLTNEMTREQLALKKMNDLCFLLVRCPIARDVSKWAEWEEEAIGWEIDFQWNRIDIHIFREEHIGDGLLDSTPGTSDQQQK